MCILLLYGHLFIKRRVFLSRGYNITIQTPRHYKKQSVLSGRIVPLDQQSCITNRDAVQSIYQPVVEILCVSTTIICLRLSISFVLDLLRPYKLVET